MSRLPFELLLALRYLRPKRTFVSIITLISIVGVMLGVAVLIIVISVMSGFDKQLRDKILGFNAHIRVTKTSSSLRDFTRVMSRVAANPNVKGVAPYVQGQVLVETQPQLGESLVSAPWIRGVDPKAEATVSILSASIREGTFDVRGNGVLIGRVFAEAMNLGVGDKLLLYSAADLRKIREKKGKADEEATLPDDYVVRGVFDLGYYEYNASVIIVSLANAQDLYGLDDSIHGLVVALHDPDRAEGVREQLQGALGGNFTVTTWAKENSEMLNAVLVEKNVMFYLLFFIMIVAAFGITSALITFVVQKTREIGMLMALGATSAQVMWLFLSQSMMVGILGVLSGFGLGILAVSYRNQFLGVMRRVTGFELFPAKIYNFTELPALLQPADIAVICCGSLLICLLAGLLPAYNAGRLKPVEALRHE